MPQSFGYVLIFCKAFETYRARLTAMHNEELPKLSMASHAGSVYAISLTAHHVASTGTVLSAVCKLYKILQAVQNFTTGHTTYLAAKQVHSDSDLVLARFLSCSFISCSGLQLIPLLRRIELGH